MTDICPDCGVELDAGGCPTCNHYCPHCGGEYCATGTCPDCDYCPDCGGEYSVWGSCPDCDDPDDGLTTCACDCGCQIPTRDRRCSLCDEACGPASGWEPGLYEVACWRLRHLVAVLLPAALHLLLGRALRWGPAGCRCQSEIDHPGPWHLPTCLCHPMHGLPASNEIPF